MQIKIDTKVDTPADIKAVIGFLAHLYNLESSDIDGGSEGEFIPVPSGTTLPKPLAGSSIPTAAPELALTAPAPLTARTAAMPVTVPTSAPHVLPVGNVINFPVPPPPSSAMIAAIADVHALAYAVPPAPVAAVAPTVASATLEYDSAGMPWDGRIHQRGMAKKKDGTWKLQKGIDQTIVQSVVMELSARKIATSASPTLPVQRVPVLTEQIPAPPQFAVPPPPPSVILPPGPLLPSDTAPGYGNPVPLPPVMVEPPVTQVPSPPVPVAVPVPPVPPVGSMGITYRSLVDKMTAGTAAKTLASDKVLEIVRGCGCPNIQQLKQMPQVWTDLDAKLDLALAGLL